MVKQSLIALTLSILVIILASQLSYLVHYIVVSHDVVTSWLSNVFSGGMIGSLIKDTLALFFIPFIIALIPTGIYFAATRKSFSYFVHILWVSWIILATALVFK